MELANKFVDGDGVSFALKMLAGVADEAGAPKALVAGALEVADAKMLFEGAAEEAAPNRLPDGAGELAPKALFDELGVLPANVNGALAGAEGAMLPNGLLAPVAALLPPKVNEEEKVLLAVLLVLPPVFCDWNGLDAGPAEKLKPPLGGAGENELKVWFALGCCWEAGGKLCEPAEEPEARGRPLSGFNCLFASWAAVARLGLSSPDRSFDPSPKKAPSLLSCCVALRFDMMAAAMRAHRECSRAGSRVAYGRLYATRARVGRNSATGRGAGEVRVVMRVSVVVGQGLDAAG